MIGKKLYPCKSRSTKLDQFNSKSSFLTRLKKAKHPLKVFIWVWVYIVGNGFPCTWGVVACRQRDGCFLVGNVEGFIKDALLGFLQERKRSAVIWLHNGPSSVTSTRIRAVTLALLPTALALRRDMRLSESLSESSLSACFLLETAFGFFAVTFASASESLLSNEGAPDEALVLEKASMMDGCFTPKWQNKAVQLWLAACWFRTAFQSEPKTASCS